MMILRIAALIALFLLFSATVHSAPAREADYVAALCEGQIEHVLGDRTRVDCLTDRYAIEYDYARKWAEAIGQSLYYAVMTGRSAGVVLIAGPSDQRYVERICSTIERNCLKIKVFLTPKVNSKAELGISVVQPVCGR